MTMTLMMMMDWMMTVMMMMDEMTKTMRTGWTMTTISCQHFHATGETNNCLYKMIRNKFTNEFSRGQTLMKLHNISFYFLHPCQKLC